MVAPSGEGAVRCGEMAMATTKQNRLYKHSWYLNTCGRYCRIKCCQNTFGENIPKISSTKSLSGHPLGAASVCKLLLFNHDENSFITGSANINEMDDEAKKFPIVTKTEAGATLNTVMSNSFGFGGTNATLIFEKV